jgi:hypothetical protein
MIKMTLPRAERLDSIPPDVVAAAMLQGLENRRFLDRPATPLPAPLGPPPEDCDQRIREAAHSALNPQEAPGGPFRKLLKKLHNLFRSVFERFHHVNLTTADQVQRLKDSLAPLPDRINQIEQKLYQQILIDHDKLNARLNECLYTIHHLRSELAAQYPSVEIDAKIPSHLPVPIDPIHVIEGLFLHTRLPAPPGRILVLAPLGLHALDLASLGFQVVLSGGQQAIPSHPALQTFEEVESKPETTQFDLIVALCAEGSLSNGCGIVGPTQAENRLRFSQQLLSGGTSIGSFLVEKEVPTPTQLKAMIEPFQLHEVQYARRAGHGWSLSPERSEEATVILWVGKKSFVK